MTGVLKKIASFFHNETNFVLLMILIITGLSLAFHFYCLFFVAPKETTYTFGHKNLIDYYQFLSYMKDGADGKFLITLRYSPDVFIRKPVYLFYPFIGFLSSVFKLPNFLGYTITRVFLGEIKLFLIYYLISLIFSKSSERKLAFVLCLFSPPILKLKPLAIYSQYLFSTDPLQRTFFVAHDLVATIAIMLGVIFLNHWLNFNKTKTIIFSALMFFLAAIANPAMLSLFYLFLGLGVGLTWLNSQIEKKRLLIGSFLAIFPGLLAIIYYLYLFTTVLPFSWLYSGAGRTNVIMSYRDFFKAWGVPAFLFFLAIPSFWKKKNLLGNFILAWAITPFFVRPLLGKIIPLPEERLFETSLFIPLSIMASVSYFWLLSRIKNLILKNYFKVVSSLSFILLVGISFWLSLKLHISFFRPEFFNLFVPNSLLESFHWLDENTADESTVAGGLYTSNMLPAFSHNRVLFGGGDLTYQTPKRAEETRKIFNEDPATPEEVEEILKLEKISYILLNGEPRSEKDTNLSKIKNLHLVYTNGEVSILQFLPNKSSAK